LLDDVIERKQDKGKWIELHHKRQPEELQRISELAQAAIGFNSARGDVISVQNLTFDRSGADDLIPPTFIEQARKGLGDYSSEVRYAGVLFLFLLVYMLMIRPIMKRVLIAPIPLLAATRTPVRIEADLDAIPDSTSSLSQRNLLLKKQLADFVRAEPESSTTAVRAWLREDTP
jgi:flagellar M-ring protein FliF